MRLRTAKPHGRGWTRRKVGSGFTYLDEHGERLDTETVDRIKALAIPPAWQEVWICPWHNGHIQATGFDAAGRKQYLYHSAWREQRDRMKFDRVLEVAGRLPDARVTWAEHLGLEGMPLDRASATAVRLLDLGYFRIGSDVYADTNGSFGLTTLEKRHVKRRGDELVFAFRGKSGKDHSIVIDDSLTLEAVEMMRRRRTGGDRLLAYKEQRDWSELDGRAVNEYLKTGAGEDISAKDFRTWHATVLAAVAIASTEESGSSERSRKRAVKEACVQVSEYLGNTPTIARNSYIDPRVFELYEDGVTIETALRRDYAEKEEQRDAIERAVCGLLAEQE